VYIEGAIRSHSYDDKDGNKRYITEIVAQRVQFLGGGGGGGGGRSGQSEGGGSGGGGFDDFGGGPIPDDDIPF
jgi:single-strand DNA-binding protein